MGIGKSFGEAFAKGQIASGQPLPQKGKVFISVRDSDKKSVIEIAREFQKSQFTVFATRGTAKILQENGIACEIINKVSEGRPHIIDMIKNGEIDFIINTTAGRQAYADSYPIRSNAVAHKICYSTTIAGGLAAARALQTDALVNVVSLQDLFL